MFEVGQRLAHYTLVQEIGSGGAGVVWKAFDSRLAREVALKFLVEEMHRDFAWLARFTHEAKILAGLSHPNIVTIHAIEEVAGQRFIVMELVRGRRLGQLIPTDGLPLDRFLELAISIADAVWAAHERDVIHRDLKPGNIMVDGEGRPKVLDFGLARSATSKRLGGESIDGDATTRTLPSPDGFGGTLSYMAPEQLRGDMPDRRSDLFALGVIFFEMATGRHPFRGKTSAEVLASILRDEPPAFVDLRPGLPRQLERIVRHALDKDPHRRFQNALDLCNELRQLAEEVRSGMTGPAVRSLAVLPFENVTGDPEQAFFADGMTDALINNLGRIRALKVISRTSVMRYKNVSQPLPDTARELGVEAVVEGSVLRAGKRARITVHLIDAARDRLLWADTYEHDLTDVLRVQSEVAQAITRKIQVEITPQERAHLERVGPVNPAVHEACLKGRHFWHKRTTESVRRGLQCFEEALELDPSYAPAHAGVADSYIVDGGRYLGVSPEVAYERAGDAARRAVELDDTLAEAHTSLAAVMTDYDWDWDGAEREYRRAIELNPSYATARSWYAEHLSRMDRHDEAIAQVRRALELDPVSVFSSMMVAWILYFARRYDEAITQALETLELDPTYATAHRILGWAYEDTGRHGEAISAHLRACELTGDAPNFTAQLGRAYALAGRTDEARGVLDRLTRLCESSYVSALDFAIIFTALGEHDRALDWLERAFDEKADHLPYLRVNPRLDALRSTERFRRLAERMGLAGDTPRV